MSTFTDWLADKSARRVALVELVSVSQGTFYLGTESYVSGQADSPANTVYEDRVSGEIVIGRRLSGPLNLRGGAANVSDLVVDNADGAYDAWPTYAWSSVTIWYGDPTWSLTDIKANGKRGSWKVFRVEADDLEIRFELADRYDDLRDPAQGVFEYQGPSFGERRPLTYGYPKNCPLRIQKSSTVQTFLSSEESTIEDPSVTRYLNQVADGTAVLEDGYRVFYNLGDPQGRVTADIKGKRDSGGSWLTTPGECLLDALTRTSPNLYGFATGGSTTTVVLANSPITSAVDDAYNGLEIKRAKPNDQDSSDVEAYNILDYDGATRAATIDGTFTTATASGDGYRIAGVETQIGPLTTADCDTAAFVALDTSLPYEIGLWMDDGRSAVDMLDDVLSPGGYHYWTPAGQLTVGLLTDPTSAAADLSLESGDLQDGADALELTDVIPPAWSIRLGYDKNHSVERNSAALGTISSARLGYISDEFRWARWEDASIPTTDPDSEQVEVGTVFTDGDDAQTELARLSALFSSRRRVFSVRAFTEPMGVSLGGVVKVTDPRHGLSAGTNFVLLGIVEDLTNGTTELELWG